MRLKINFGINGLKIVTATLFLSHINVAFAEAHPVCKLLAKEQRPVAFLLNPQGNVSDGPIDFGRVGYKHQNTGHLIIPTGYKMVIAPARLKITNCNSECIVLKEVAPICKQAKTYEVSYISPDNEEFDSDRSWLPFKQEANGIIFLAEDPNSDFEPSIQYKFQAKIIGEIYDPKKER